MGWFGPLRMPYSGRRAFAGMWSLWSRCSGSSAGWSPVYGKLCCGGHSFIIERLVLLLNDGTELELYIGDDMEKKAIALLDTLRAGHPEILFGKPAAAQ